MPITFATSNFTSYDIKWDDPYPYPECIKISITVNDSQVFGSDYEDVMNYSKLFDSVGVNNVCVIASDESRTMVNCVELISGKCGFVGTMYGHLGIGAVKNDVHISVLVTFHRSHYVFVT